MKPQEQISRNALAWIIVCLFTLVAPHAFHIPLWVLGIYIAAVLWRIQVHCGRWSFPGRGVKVGLTLGCFSGVYASYGTLIGLEPTVALLLAAFALKMIELVRRKDAYVLLFLGYFVCGTEFLFSQDLLVTLFSILNVVLVTTALVALHQPGQQRFDYRPLRLAGVMLLQALPLMAALFFLFPRIGPLWTVPIKTTEARTGMSEFMRPGDVARISQSGDVVFRASFEGDIPPVSQLYWRGLVFSRLEDNTWTMLSYFDLPRGKAPLSPVAETGDPLRYTVIMSPSNQNWLYALHYAESRDPDVKQSADYRLYAATPVESEYLYRAESWPQATVETQISDWRRRTETQLPASGDERTRQLARELRQRVSTDAEFVDVVLAHFNREAFVYTLQPGTLPSSSPMDHFMFDSRRGFCEHFAYAFVTMMRAAGVPARVVAGYQGGEINPVNNTVIVHQFDAHAWAEVWLPEQGWRRVDPTAAVAPARIEWGLEEALRAEGSFLAESPLSPLRYRGIPLVNLLRLRYDALTWRWQSWVVGFDNERQIAMLHDMFGEVSPRLYAVLLLGTGTLVLMPVALSLLGTRDGRRRAPLDRYYQLFCDRLAGLGIARPAGETATAFGRRAARARPDLAPQIGRITRLYNQLAFTRETDHATTTRRLAALQRAVRAFRPGRRSPSGAPAMRG